MKKFCALFLFYFCFSISAQTSRSTENAMVELYLLSKDSNNPTSTTTFSMQKVSGTSVWGGAFPGGNYSDLYTWLTDDYDQLDNYVAVSDDAVHEGYEFVISSDNQNYDDFGYGKYKLTAAGGEEDYFIYLDYRDDKYGFYPSQLQGTTGHPMDVWIKFNRNDESFYINSYTGACSSPDWDLVVNGSTVNIWSLKGQTRSTAKFKPGVPDNFYIDEKEENWPILSWNQSSEPNDYWVGYKIYRAITNLWNDPRNFSHLTSVGKYTTNYEDTEVEFGGWDFAWYYIVAKNDSVDSDPTDELGAALISLNKSANGKLVLFKNPSIKEYKLASNYPNPFNPTTMIYYDVKEIGNVQIIIYDALGRRVTELVNEVKEPGSYNIHFDGSKLSNGVYYYMMKSGDFIQTKKMILMK